MKAGLASAVAVGTGLVSIVEAQTPAGSTNRVPATATGARMNGPLFFDVETATGLVRGMANTGIKVFRGIPTAPTRRAGTASCRRASRRRGPACATGIGYGPISPQTASGYRSDYSQLITWDRHVGSGGMSEDCLSLNIWTPGVNDNAQARRAGVVPRRRLGHRLRQRTDVRRRPTRAARRRRRRHRQPPAGELRLHAPGGGRRARGIQVRRRLRRHGHGRVARVGARQHRRRSAAIRRA